MTATRNEPSDAKSEPLQRLANALSQNLKNKEIAKLLDPSLLQQTTPDKRNIVHIAAQHARSIDAFKLICKFVEQNHHAELFMQPDANGHTPLHVAAVFGSYKVNKYLLKCLKDKAVTATKMITHEGKFPSQLVRTGKHEVLDGNIIRAFLESYMREPQLPPLSKLIDFKELETRYETEIKADPSLKNRLQYVVDQINELRKHFIYSDTHPTSRGSTEKTVTQLREEAEKKIDAIIAKYNSELSTLEEQPLDEKTTRQAITILKTGMQEQRDEYYNLHYKYQTANCGEFARFGSRNSDKLAPSTLVEEYRIVKGDHAFNIFYRDPLSHPGRPNDFAIAGDAWGGFVCLARDLSHHLKNYHSYDSFSEGKFRFIAPFNSNYHFLEPTRANHPKIEILSGLLPMQRKIFLQHRNHLDQTELHQVMDEPFLIVKIYFNFIKELKDSTYTQDLLMAKDKKGQTALHLCAVGHSSKRLRLVFDEYKAHLGDKLQEVLFGENFSDERYLAAICKNRYPDALYDLCVVGRTYPDFLAGFDKQIKNIFLQAIKDEKNILQVQFMLSFPAFVTAEILAEADKIIPKQNSVIRDAFDLFIRYRLLLQFKKSLAKSMSANVGIFKLTDAHNKLRKSLEELPDVIVFDHDAQLNISKALLDKMQQCIKTAGEDAKVDNAPGLS